MQCHRIVIRGRVQGVGFRAFVASAAAVHGVVGEVWNTRDGCVEVLAQAPSLDSFVQALRSGPGHINEIVETVCQPIVAEAFRISATR